MGAADRRRGRVYPGQPTGGGLIMSDNNADLEKRLSALEQGSGCRLALKSETVPSMFSAGCAGTLFETGQLN